MRIGPAVRSVLNSEGFASLQMHNVSINGSTASQWNSGACGNIAQLLAADGDARLIHVIVGGNDLLAGLWNPSAAVQQTITNTMGVLNAIAAATHAPILFTGYEYLAAAPAGMTQAACNGFQNAYVNGVAQAVAGSAVLSSRVTVLNTHGLMQVHYGIPQLGIAPFEPSLPNANLPGPSTAYADSIHLTPAAYGVLAQKLYDDVYALALVPEPGTGSIFVIGCVAISMRRLRSRG